MHRPLFWAGVYCWRLAGNLGTDDTENTQSEIGERIHLQVLQREPEKVDRPFGVG